MPQVYGDLRQAGERSFGATRPGVAAAFAVGPARCGSTLFTQDVVVWLTLRLAVALWAVLSHSKWGLIIRAVGENPHAARAIGFRVLQILVAAVAGQLHRFDKDGTPMRLHHPVATGRFLNS